jgi:S-adenosylmethionine/arginine decarboxylase-like enzyme
MRGLHLTADLHGCRGDPGLLTDAERLAALCRTQVERVGLTAVGEQWVRFPQLGGPSAAGRGGVTGVLLLAESHLAVHTWPELDAVTLDVYVCNHGRDNADRAQALLRAVVDAFRPARSVEHRLERGVRDRPDVL